MIYVVVVVLHQFNSLLLSLVLSLNGYSNRDKQAQTEQPSIKGQPMALSERTKEYLENPVPIYSIDPRTLATFYREMADRRIDLDNYKLSFYKTSGSFLIVANHERRTPYLRGSDPHYPTYEVLISRIDHSVTRVSIAR